MISRDSNGVQKIFGKDANFAKRKKKVISKCK